MASEDTRTTRQLLEALDFKYSQGDHDSLVRAALRELEQRRRRDAVLSRLAKPGEPVPFRA